MRTTVKVSPVYTSCMFPFILRIYHSICFLYRKVSHLGSGEFGVVNKGLWTSERGALEVAVKTLTDSANTVKFLQETAIMAQFKHPNIIALYGVVSQGMPVSVLVYFLANIMYLSYTSPRK